MTLVIYGDFTCPACYLASWRADLLAGGDEAVDWRAVEHEPRRPLTGEHPGPRERGCWDERWQAVQAVLLSQERLPGRLPAVVPSTRGAVAAYAEAYGAGVPDRARRLLFRACWVDGRDIGDPEVLRGLLGDTIRSGHSASPPLREWGYAVSAARGPVTTSAFRLIRDWRRAWSSSGAPQEPLLVGPDGVSVVGRAVLTELGRLLEISRGEVGDDGGVGRHRLAALPPHQSSGRFWV